MEEAIIVLIGLGVMATSRRVPVLRAMVKAVVKTGMIVAEAAGTVAAVVGEQVSDLVGHAGADHARETIVDAEAPNETAGAASEFRSSLANTDLLQIDGMARKRVAICATPVLIPSPNWQRPRLTDCRRYSMPLALALEPSIPVPGLEQAQALLGGGLSLTGSHRSGRR